MAEASQVRTLWNGCFAAVYMLEIDFRPDAKNSGQLVQRSRNGAVLGSFQQVGAYTVMNSDDFTIGKLIAFQMFTVNQLKGKVGMIFITHAMPKNLLVDEIVRIVQGSLSAVSTAKNESNMPTIAGLGDGKSVAPIIGMQASHQGAESQSPRQETKGRMEA